MPVSLHRMRPALAAGLLIAAVAGVAPATAGAAALSRPSWVSGTQVTEYFPVPEAWFTGVRVATPGLERPSRVDWLYSATGVSMEGDGIGEDGRRYHIEGLGSSGWITRRGRRATFGVGGSRAPYWRGEGFWRDRRGTVTFPLEAGGWSAGEGKTYKPTSGITFAEGPSRPLRYGRSVAVDPGLIPLGSIVNIPAYKPVNGDGWFRADDTGGAIDGRHLDVFRRPPESADDPGSTLSDQRVYVVPVEDIAAYLRRQTLRPGRLPKVPERILTPGRLGRAP